MLCCALLMLAVFSVVSAQVSRTRDPQPAGTNRRRSSTVSPNRSVRPLPGGTNLTQVPVAITKRKYKPRAGVITRVAGDQVAARVTLLLTKLNPEDQVSAVAAPSQDEHPFATADEKFIYFDSDRADDTTKPQSSTGIFNIFRMFLDGSGVTQITTGNSNKIEPAVSQDGSRVAYVSGGAYTNLNANLDTPASNGFNLFFVDLNAGGNPISLTVNNASAFTFVDVRHPTWSSAGDKIAFAGRRDTDPGHYHIFIVDVQSVIISQMTQGPSNDYAPSWSPDGRLIAFTTNSNGFSAGAAPINAATTANTDDIWVMNPNPVVPDPNRVTFFAINGKQSSNKNPSWSTLRFDPLQIVTPPETDVNGNPVSGANLLAFASNRVDKQDPNQPGATDVTNTFDIYWMRASIKPDPNVGGAFTVTTPEAVSPTGNHAMKLRTSTPDVAIDPTDPASMFDPNFISNEDYPSWPQFINSYRIFYQSNRGVSAISLSNNLNIFGSTIFDINAPSLLKYSIENNEIIHVARDSAPEVGGRQFNAGDVLRFRTRVVDYESGVKSVYLQIKNPNSAQQSADGVEHKTYVVGFGILDMTTTVVNPPYEWDSQAINPTTMLYRKQGRQPANYQVAFGRIPTQWPGWNQYVAGIDDANAMTGISNPPDDDAHDFSAHDFSDPEGGFWLQLWDDGPISKGGHEPEGEVAGDDVFTQTWQTPVDQPSDFYMDLIVYDNAVDPFNTPTDTRGINWKIYDNVWGFSTAPFLGKGNWLYVNDYDSGQRFFQTLFGPGLPGTGPTAFGTAFTGWGTESWNTEFDTALFPTVAFQSGTAHQLLNVLTPLGLNSYGGVGAFNFDPSVPLGPGNIPATGAYDQWRILSRGPVPDSVLNSYLGHLEVQPPDILANGTGPTNVFVAEKAVIWHSPYSGRLFIGPGTLLDNDTQVRLGNFVHNGGRLLVNGGQVAFGLTLGQSGGGINPFLNQVLHATFVNDFQIPFPADNAMTPVPGQGTHPIISETFYGPNLPGLPGATLVPFEHQYPSTGTPPRDYPSSGTVFLGSIPNTPRDWMCLNGGVDEDNIVLFTAPLNMPDRSDVDLFYAGGSAVTQPAIMWFTDVTIAPRVSKVIFSPFGWEDINPEYFLPPGTNPPVVLKNRRVEIMHNAGDYLRTGSIVGNIRDVNGATPVNHAFLRAVSQNGLQAGMTVSTAFSQADGSYVLNGLDANGLYNIQGQKAGFITHTQFATIFHGGTSSRLDFFLTEAQPGSIAGTVTLQVGGAPVAGINVVAQSISDPSLPLFTATTDIKGQYTIKNVAPDIYMVSLPPNTPGNRTALGFGDSTPPSYGYITTVVPAGWPAGPPPAGIKPPVTVGTAPTPAPVGTIPAPRDDTGVDFQLKQAPGRILGLVTDATTKLGIGGAAVTAVSGSSSFSAVTAADGTYTIPNVDPAVYIVTAQAAGFATGTLSGITVNTAKDTINVNFALNPVPPGSLSGLVASSNGVAIGGATVTVFKLDGTSVLATTTTGAVQTVGTNTFNYRFSNDIPAGAKVIVDASKSGFTNKTGRLTVGPINPGPAGPETEGVNFTLDPLFTFQNSLTLVSAPFEFTTDIASLFSIPAADVANKSFAFLTWDPAKAQYISFPTPPADTFHLGLGYFMQEVDSQFSLSLTQAGTLAPLASLNGTPTTPDYKPFPIHLQAGWNLIGDPFVYSLDFLTLQIQEQDGTIKDVLTAQSGANPALGAALWTYENGNYAVVFTLDPFRGYFVRAFRPVTLLVLPTSQQGRSAGQSAMHTLLQGNAEGGAWKLNLFAESGGVRSAPGIVGVNPAATDTYDVFKLEAPPAASSRAVSLTFDHSDWALKPGKYSVDVRSVGTAQQKWSMLLNSTVNGEPVTITWPSMATVPGKYDVVLTDEDAHTTIQMRNQFSYTIPAGKAAGSVTRHFTVSVQRAQRSLLGLADITARVNNTGTRGPTSAEIGYTLTSSATVQVSILHRGRSIRTLEQGVTRAAGISQTVWDLRQGDGSLAPADIYNVEVIATDATGQKVRRLVPLQITR
jgi:hypothetical protein